MIYTVFSTTDSPYMQWQSELLEYSWKRAGQPGELIRLVATDDPNSLPQHRWARSIATRQWNIHPFTGDDFAPYNKPASLLEWLTGERPHGTLLLLDPDCVFRAPVEREVLPGHPVGQHWIDFHVSDHDPFGLDERFEAMNRHCVNTRSRVDPVMIPNLIHTDDMQRIALRWLELTGAVRQEVRNHQDNPMWESDMFGFIMASAEYGLSHELGTLGICTNWSPDDVKDAPIIHYCQAIHSREGDVIWSKGHYRPWEKVEDPSRAAQDYGRDLLELLNDFVDERQEPAAAPSGRPKRRAEVSERRVGDEVEVLPPGSNRAFFLNFSAQAIWDLCDGASTVDEILQELSQRFGTRQSDLSDDLVAALRDFEEAGLLEFDRD